MDLLQTQSYETKEKQMNHISQNYTIQRWLVGSVFSAYENQINN